jgi:hypothetical protein
MVLVLIPRSTRSSRILSRSLRFAVIAASFGSAPPMWRAGEGSGWLAPRETYETDSKTAPPCTRLTRQRSRRASDAAAQRLSPMVFMPGKRRRRAKRTNLSLLATHGRGRRIRPAASAIRVRPAAPRGRLRPRTAGLRLSSLVVVLDRIDSRSWVVHSCGSRIRTRRGDFLDKVELEFMGLSLVGPSRRSERDPCRSSQTASRFSSSTGSITPPRSETCRRTRARS